MVSKLTSGPICTRLPWEFPAFLIFFRGKNVAEVNHRRCLDEIGQWLENVDQTHQYYKNEYPLGLSEISASQMFNFFRRWTLQTKAEKFRNESKLLMSNRFFSVKLRKWIGPKTMKCHFPDSSDSIGNGPGTVAAALSNRHIVWGVIGVHVLCILEA